MNGFLHGVPCVQEQPQPRNFEADTAYDVKAFHGGQPFQEVLNTLGDFPRKERRTNGKHTGEDFVNVVPHPIKEGLNLRHDLVNLFVHCVCDKVIGWEVKAKTAATNAASTASSTACAIVRRGDNIQFINTKECAFQFFRLFRSVPQTVSGFTRSACYTADCVRSHVELWNRNAEEPGDNLSDHANCFRQCDCVWQNRFQNREEKVA